MSTDSNERAASKQGLHFATFRKIMREEYDLEDEYVTHIERYQDEDEKWWDMFYIPLEKDMLLPEHQKRIVEVLFGRKGEPIGLHLLVRNYHYLRDSDVNHPVERKRMSAEDRKIKQGEYYLLHKEEFKKRAREQYQRNKLDPEWCRKKRAESREYYREKKGVIINSEETVRRNEVRRNVQKREDQVDLKLEARLARIAELDKKIDNGEELTEVEALELERLYEEEPNASGY